MRFTPTETELVGYYLNSRIDDKNFRADFVIECLHFYRTEPLLIWVEYVDDAESNKGDRTLYFFARRRWTSENSTRFDRRVGSGTWSSQYARDVYDDDVEAIGTRREFRYEGSCEKDPNKAWLLKEYQTDEQDAIVLCALKRNPRQMPPTVAKNMRKIKADRSRVKRCKVEEEDSCDEEEEEQGVVVDVPKTEEKPLMELVDDHSMMQAMVPYYGFEDCFCPDFVLRINLVRLLLKNCRYAACCDGSSNLMSTEERSMDFLSMLVRL